MEVRASYHGTHCSEYLQWCLAVGFDNKIVVCSFVSLSGTLMGQQCCFQLQCVITFVFDIVWDVSLPRGIQDRLYPSWLGLHRICIMFRLF